jgi:hypothetical protein
LCIDRATEAELPDLTALTTGFAAGLGAPVSEVSRESEEDWLAVVLRMEAGDAGPGESLVMLGARRLGEEIFLCASEPGAAPAEVQQALSVCRGLRRGPAADGIR